MVIGPKTTQCLRSAFTSFVASYTKMVVRIFDSKFRIDNCQLLPPVPGWFNIQCQFSNVTIITTIISLFYFRVTTRVLYYTYTEFFYIVTYRYVCAEIKQIFLPKLYISVFIHQTTTYVVLT